MAPLLTFACELALLGLLWILWRAAERADQEVEVLTQPRSITECAPNPESFSR